MSYPALAAARETLNVQCYRSAMAPERRSGPYVIEVTLKAGGKPVDIWAWFW